VTRAKSIAFAIRIGMRSAVKEIRRHFNVAKKERGMKWVYGHPTQMALLLPRCEVRSFARLARDMEDGQ
jgi:hypothetical protein